MTPPAVPSVAAGGERHAQCVADERGAHVRRELPADEPTRIGRLDVVAADALAGPQQRLPGAPVAVGVVVGRVDSTDALQ